MISNKNTKVGYYYINKCIICCFFITLTKRKVLYIYPLPTASYIIKILYQDINFMFKNVRILSFQNMKKTYMIIMIIIFNYKNIKFFEKLNVKYKL